MIYKNISIFMGNKTGEEHKEFIDPCCSPKWFAFITCYADQTKSLAVIGDVSDPYFVSETIMIPSKAKYLNPNIELILRTTFHESFEQSIKSGYDKFILNIDENFTQDILDKFIGYEDKVQFNFIINIDNYDFLSELAKLKNIENFQLIIDSHIDKDEDNIMKYFNSFLEMSGEDIRYNRSSIFGTLDDGFDFLLSKPNIKFWNYQYIEKKPYKTLQLKNNGEIVEELSDILY